MLIDVEFNSRAVYPPSGIIEASRLAEQKGFSAVWEGEANNKDPIVLMSAVASHTTRIQVGTFVTHIFARTPVTTGIMAATLDELSGGRFLCGIGCSNPTIAGWHGLEYDAPLRRIEEYIDIFRKVIRQEKLQYQGNKYSSNGFRLPFTPIRKDIPVYIAALRPRMTALAGKLSDGVMITLGTPDHVREQVAQMRQAAEEAGRDPQSLEVIVEVMCCMNGDLKLAEAPLKEACTFYGLADFYGDMFAREGFADEIEAMRASYRKGGFRAALAQISDEMLLRLPVVAATNTDQIRRRLDDYEAAGATRVILAYTPATNDPTTEVLQFLQGW